jgi:hypothetical protein
MAKRLLLFTIVGCMAAGLLAASASAVEVKGPNPDGYYGCNGLADSPNKSNGIIGSYGAIDCGFHHTQAVLQVCMQVDDVIDGWLNRVCVSDCRGQLCTWGSGAYYYTGYALVATAGTCYDPHHVGNWYRTWTVASWPINNGWHNSQATTPPVWIPC